MINEHDINDWDKESQEAYLKWAKEYGLDYEPWIGKPDVSAAWIAAVKWTKGQNKPLNDEDVYELLSPFCKKYLSIEASFNKQQQRKDG